MLNPKIFKNNKVCVLLIFFLAVSYPLAITFKTIFGFFLMCTLLISPLFLHKLLVHEYRTDFKVKIYLSWVRVLFYLLGLMMLSSFIDKYFHVNNPIVIIVLCWLLFGIMFVWVIDILWILTKQLQKIIRTGEKSNYIIILCAIIILLAFIAPEISFAYGYKIFFSVLYGTELENLWEAFYLSFVITYTLPVANEKLLTHIDLINREFILYTYQIVQVYFKKFIDIVLIALIVGHLQDLIKNNVKKSFIK